MAAIDTGAAIAAVKQYLKSDTLAPCFVAFDSWEQLNRLRNELSECKTLFLSGACREPDAKPDLDRIKEWVRACGEKKNLLLGVGEYVALTGDRAFLRELVGFRLASGKRLVVTLWNGHDALAAEVASDPRISEKGCAVLIQREQKLWQVKQIGAALPIKVDCKGFAKLLGQLEAGCDREVTVKTDVRLLRERVSCIESAAAAYREAHPGCKAHEALFSEDVWMRLLDENRSRNMALESFDTLLDAVEHPPRNVYHRQVVAQTARFRDYERNLLCGLLTVPRSDERFRTLYTARKELLSGWMTEDRAAGLVRAAGRFAPEERIAYLTDLTVCEKAEILRCVAEIGAVPEAAARAWPDLADYLKSFPARVADAELGGLIGRYFEDYKRNKILGRIPPEFQELVEEIAVERRYNRLPARGCLVDRHKGRDAALYWLDAFGCEYLGFVAARARDAGLRMTVELGRAELPTITSRNRAFWEEWDGPKADSKELDEIKHGKRTSAGETPQPTRAPLHLIDELATVAETVTRIAAKLKSGEVGKVVLASDHGATRLAVVSGRETVWEMPERGRHGGRCCKIGEYDGERPRCVTDSDDGVWHVLANYDRFKGGRRQDVEVHGGATMEEIVVPVVTFELWDAAVKVELLTKTVKLTRRDTTVELVFFSERAIADFSVSFEGKRYVGTAMRGGRYRVELPRLRVGTRHVEVFSGDSAFGTFAFTVENAAAASLRNDFDFFK